MSEELHSEIVRIGTKIGIPLGQSEEFTGLLLPLILSAKADTQEDSIPIQAIQALIDSVGFKRSRAKLRGDHETVISLTVAINAFESLIAAWTTVISDNKPE